VRANAIHTLLVLTFTCATSAQLVHIGGPAPTCEEFLKSEKLKPNLVVANRVVTDRATISGVVRDASGAPFAHTRVELRKASKSLLVRETDDNGRFMLGDVADGDYRLIFRNDRAFQQASGLECIGKTKCELAIKLDANPTDQEGGTCPPR